ncbi:MAG: alpha/beta hydrolase [Nonlabens sp.]
MKLPLKALSILFLVNLSFTSFAQDLEGTWVGGITNLPLIFEFTEKGDSLSVKMQSPKQSKQFIDADLAIKKGDSIIIGLSPFKIKYKGVKKGKVIDGIFSQGAGSTPMRFEKKAYVPEEKLRPQTPKAPFPYQIEEVAFINESAGGIKLAGTLTIPPGVKNPPVAILISGSGPQDRDETIYDHKPFLVLADHLTKNGIAVLRYDDRGVAGSQGNFPTSTSTDFATDVLAAVNYLAKRGDVDKDKIGLIGHSEGGAIAPMVIAENPEKVAFFVSLAGIGVKGSEVLRTQLVRKAELDGVDQEIIKWEAKMMQDLFETLDRYEDGDQEKIETAIRELIERYYDSGSDLQKAKYPKSTHQPLAAQFSSGWMASFLRYDPTENLKKVTVPTLLLNGSLDYQVIPELNLPPMEKWIKSNGNKDVTVMELEGLNHLFQTATTGNGTEYDTIEETIAPVVLNTITEWINERF